MRYLAYLGYLCCALLVLAACSIPATKQLVTADAPAGPYACLNQPLPPAHDQVNITGTVADPYTGNAIAGATVDGYLGSATTAILDVPTGSDGAFAAQRGTGGVAQDFHFSATSDAYETTDFYPAVAVWRDLDIQFQLLTTTDLQSLAGVADVAIDESMAQLVVSVTDCNGNPVAGATVSTDPAGTVRYLVDAAPSAGATSTDGMTGSALVFNVAPSTTSIMASAGGMALRTHSVLALAGTLTQTEIQP